MREQCLNCEAPISQKEGSRERKFCSDSCRASFHQKNNKKPVKDKVPPKWVYDYFKKNPDDLVKTIGIKDLTVPANEIKPKEQPKTNYVAKVEKKKEMPIGLSRTEQMRWLRDNS